MYLANASDTAIRVLRGLSTLLRSQKLGPLIDPSSLSLNYVKEAIGVALK